MFINQPAKLSQVVTHIALGVAVLFGSLAAPAIGSSPPTYSLIAQESKSPADLLWTIQMSDRESSQQKIQALERLIQTYPDFADAYIYRGQIYKEIKNYQKAIQNFDRAIALSPKDYNTLSAAYYERGLAFSELKKYPAAFKDFTQAIEIKGYDKGLISPSPMPIDYDVFNDPEFLATKLYYNRALILWRLGKKSSALNDLNRIAFMGNGDIHYLRGRIRSEIGDKSGSKKDYDLAALLYLDSIIRKNQFKFSNSQALSKIGKAIELSPNNTCAYYYRGTIQQKNKNIPAAIQSFTQVINFFKNDVNKSKFLSGMYEKRGDLYAELNNAQNAVKDYDRAAQLGLANLDFPADFLRICRASNIASLHISFGFVLPPQVAGMRILPSEQEAQSRLANFYHKRGIAKKAKQDQAGAIQDLQKALAIFVRFSDKTNEQKVRTVLNSLRSSH